MHASLHAGVLRKDFHAHELQFHDRVVGHVCDMCGLRLVAGAKGLRFGGFRCKTCDFDCCMRCFCRKDRNTAEGGIRSDKGTKSDQVPDTKTLNKLLFVMGAKS